MALLFKGLAGAGNCDKCSVQSTNLVINMAIAGYKVRKSIFIGSS